MSSLTQFRDTVGDWVFIAPVANLVLTDAVNREFRIERVTFVHAQKFPRVRKRFGIRRRVSQWHDALKSQIQGAHTLAIVRHRGKPDDSRAKCFQLVEEAIYILTASQLHWARRDRVGRPLLDESPVGVKKHLLLSTQNGLATGGSELADRHPPLLIDATWRTWHRESFFAKLLRILDKKTPVSSSWRRNLRRAAILVGESLQAGDLHHAFLWNMIALETLLTRRGDKYPEALVERTEAFLGWAGFWHQQGFPEKIKQVYKLRCRFVHDGEASDLTMDDVEFTDCLLLNALNNLVSHPELFKSKNHVIAFSDQVAAEKLLGLRSRVRPKKLIAFPLPTKIRPILEE